MLTTGCTAEEERIIAGHFTYLKELTDKGVVSLAGRTDSTGQSSFGIVLFTASSEKAARRMMENDPAVKQRVMRAELFPFSLALLGNLPRIEQ